MRKEKQYHFIYKITNLLNGKYYIGMHSTNNLNDGYLGSGKRLRYSINKYGKENHVREELEFCKSREELKSRETEIVNLNEIAKNECMNLRIGGEGGISLENGLKLAKIGSKAFLKKFKTDVILQQKFKEHGNKTYLKLCETGKILAWIHSSKFKGKNHSDETKKKIGLKNSIHQKGTNNSQFGKCWITNEIINKKIYQGDEIPNGFRLGRKIK